MEQLTRPAQIHNFTSFSTLPSEIKEQVVSFVIPGTLKNMSRSIFTIAALDKKHHAWINNPQRMIRIFNSLTRICNRRDVHCTLCSKEVTLPVLDSPEFSAFIARDLYKVPLQKGPELISTMRFCYEPMLEKLLQEPDIDLNYKSPDGIGVLEWNFNVRTLKMVLDAGANPNIEVPQTALMIAAALNDIPAMKLLIEAGAKINTPVGNDFENDIDTFVPIALSFAIEKGNIEAVKLLIAAGTLIWESDCKLARRKGFHEIARLLECEQERRYEAINGKKNRSCAIS